MHISLRSVFVASALASVAFASCSPATVSPDGGGADAANDVGVVNDSGSDQASCNGLGDTCGPNGNQSCCLAAVAGGTFIRDYDGVDSATKPYVDTSHTATLSAFTLDTYPVTIGRFRKFFELYPASLPQHDGDGKNPNNPDCTRGFVCARDDLLCRG